MVGIAQLVEQRTENPRVTSSNLVPDTEKIYWIDIQINREGSGYIFVNSLEYDTYLFI